MPQHKIVVRGSSTSSCGSTTYQVAIGTQRARAGVALPGTPFSLQDFTCSIVVILGETVKTFRNQRGDVVDLDAEFAAGMHNHASLIVDEYISTMNDLFRHCNGIDDEEMAAVASAALTVPHLVFV